MQRIDVGGGVELDVSVSGEGEPVLLIHGALLADPFLPFFARPELDGYQLVAYRRRGYGSAHDHVTTDARTHARDASAVLGSLGIERAHVVGHSAGGGIALQLAVDAPKTVATLALFEPLVPVSVVNEIATPDGIASVSATLQGLSALAQLARTEARRAVEMFAMIARESIDTNLGVAAIDRAVDDVRGTFDGDVPMSLSWQLDRRSIAAIQVPVLSVLGTNSGLPHSAIRDVVLRLLPQARTVDILGAGHLLQVDQPGAVAKALAAFLGQHRCRVGAIPAM